MVFLRPVVMRDSDSTTKLSLDRYEQIRARQQEVQPPASVVLPVGEGPVVPGRNEAVPPAPAASTPPPQLAPDNNTKEKP